jgi:uncharacterized protein (TIGR03066 family)
MKAHSLLVLGVLAVGLTGSAAADEKDYPKDILGKWEITKSDSAPVGTVVEFTKDGKVLAVVKDEGQEIKIEGTYKVEKDKLTTKIKLPDGTTTNDTDSIKKLTEDALELEDKDKKATIFKRKK